MKHLTNSIPKFLWNYFSKYKILFFIVVIICPVTVFLENYALYFISQLVEVLSSPLSKDVIFNKALLYLGITAIVLSLNAIITGSLFFLEARFMPYIWSQVQKDMFSHVHNHSTRFFNEEMAGNVTSKVNNVIDNLYPLYYNLRYGFFTSFISLIITMGFITTINISLTLIFTSIISIMIFIIYKLSKQMAIASKNSAKAENEKTAVLVDSVINQDLVKSFSRFKHERKFFFNSLKFSIRFDRIETVVYAKTRLTFWILSAIFQCIFLMLPLFYWYKGIINIADFIFIQTMIMSIIGYLSELSGRFTDFFRAYGKMQNGLDLLSRPFDIKDVKNAKKLIIKSPTIEYKNILYHYKGVKPLFQNFNLKVKAYEKIGLVGYSGSGKTTFIKILMRYYDIQKGQILINGQDIKKVTQNSLRENIALISQDPSLFNRTIIENIRYGNPKATDEEVFEAAKKAYIHDFIMSLPEKYNTKVGDRGVILSGGERQRVSIARAFLKDAPILILDEATSALDSLSEKYIQKSLEVLMKKKTVIAIAHRLSTLKNMDKIIILNKGLIVSNGTHESLIKKDGIYKDLWKMQTNKA